MCVLKWFVNLCQGLWNFKMANLRSRDDLQPIVDDAPSVCIPSRDSTFRRQFSVATEHKRVDENNVSFVGGFICFAFE